MVPLGPVLRRKKKNKLKVELPDDQTDTGMQTLPSGNTPECRETTIFKFL